VTLEDVCQLVGVSKTVCVAKGSFEDSFFALQPRFAALQVVNPALYLSISLSCIWQMEPIMVKPSK
jgi:hypothetical protein